MERKKFLKGFFFLANEMFLAPPPKYPFNEMILKGSKCSLKECMMIFCGLTLQLEKD